VHCNSSLSNPHTQVENYRDAALLQDCDSGVRLLCKYLNWESDLDQLIQEFHSTRKSPPASGDTTPESTSEAAQSTGVVTSSSNTTTTNALSAEDEKKLNYNWKKPPPVLPPLQPITLLSEVGTGGAAAAENNDDDESSPNMTCTLCEPSTWSEVQGGTHAWFKVGFRNNDLLAERQIHDYDYLGLYQGGAKLCDEKTDRDWPFSEKAPAYILLKEEIKPPMIEEVVDAVTAGWVEPEAAAAAEDNATKPIALSQRHATFEPPFIDRALRLRIPWIHYQLPYDLEIWYMDGTTNDVLARWGPLTIHENMANDPREEEQKPGPGKGMPKLTAAEKQELMAKLSAEFGLPPEMIAGMIQGQLDDTEGGGAAGNDDDDDDAADAGVEGGEGGGAVTEPDDGKSALRAGFSAFKQATSGS
jgi:hypothetical protein